MGRNRPGATEATWIRPILGRADDMRAEVWLRCDPAAAGVAEADTAAGPLTVVGTLTGPSCTLAATLPTTAALADQGAGDGRAPLARGLCTEPGFWTPELPCLYRAEVELRRGDRVVASGWRHVGLRRAGARGRSIWLDGRRYVPRGVACDGSVDDLKSLRSLHAAAVIAGDRLGTAVESAADRAGVAIVVRVPVPGDGPDAVGGVAAAIAERALHPSVLLSILPATLSADVVAAIARATSQSRGTMLLATAVDGRLPPPPLPPGIDVVVVELPAGGLPHAAWHAGPGLPLVACETGAAAGPAEARAACDSLQARLADWGSSTPGASPVDWAGYLVG